MALTGHLSDLSLSELIEFFCNQRKTGQLKVLYPQGPGYFHLQTGSVVDARIGVLRGIDAVYYALTLPNAKFEFGGEGEPTERTINQPWTQVVLEGLRRLDEGIVPSDAFPPDYQDSTDAGEEKKVDEFAAVARPASGPSFLSMMGSESVGKRKFVIAGAVAVVVIASVAAIGVPAGWYGRAKAPVVQPAVVASQPEAPAQVSAPVPASVQPNQQAAEGASQAAKRQREKDKEKEKAKAREEKAALTQASSATPSAASEAAKPGAKKITVTVTYDESGRVTQASGGDAGAIRIARQKRFPAGKAGSATITIPVN